MKLWAQSAALGMFKVFGRTRPQNLGGSAILEPKNSVLISFASSNDFDV